MAAVHPTTIVVISRLAAIVKPLIDQKYITISARKKTANYRNI